MRLPGARSLLFLLVTWLFGYLSYHAVYGQRGYLAWCEKRKKLMDAAEELRMLRTSYECLAQKVNLMQEDIDPDILEQGAWTLLRQLSPNKFVILLPP